MCVRVFVCVMAQVNHKQKYKVKDGTGGYGEHHQEEKIAVDRPRVTHGQG